MAETYEQIIKEIKTKDYNTGEYCTAHDCGRPNVLTTHFTDAMLHFAARVRDAVAGDPSEWWVLDADGNRVHIGDTVESSNSGLIAVIGLSGEDDGRKIVQYSDGFDYADTVRKVIPDTREKIIEDTFNRIRNVFLKGNIRKSDYIEPIGDAVDRAMKLGAE